MDLRRLRYFVAVAEEGSVGRAAVRLRMAQPPLSVQIRKLESEVGTSLFRRDTRGMELTAAGRALLSRAREALAQSIIGPVGTPRETRRELANCDGAKVANSAEPARSISYRATWRSQTGAASYNVVEYRVFGAPEAPPGAGLHLSCGGAAPRYVSCYVSCPASKSSSKRKCFTLRPRRRTSFKASIPILICLSTKFAVTVRSDASVFTPSGIIG